jgi:hypothetical protein
MSDFVVREAKEQFRNPQINKNLIQEMNNYNSQVLLSQESIEENIMTTEKKSEKIVCKCKKSKCLKLYCECFANGDMCQNCICENCHNIEEYEDERNIIINSIKEKNPNAFKPKIDEKEVKHNKGCNCNKSNCQKKYCECFQSKVACTESCRCRECKNTTEYQNFIRNETIDTPRFNPKLLQEMSRERDNRSIFSFNPRSNINRDYEISMIPKKQKNNIIISDDNLVEKSVSGERLRKRNSSKRSVKMISNKKRGRKSKVGANYSKIKTDDNFETPQKQKTFLKEKVQTPKLRSNNFRNKNLNYKELPTPVISTAHTTSKRRANAKLNPLEFDKTVMKKLNMNFNNEPLFGKLK